MFIKTSALLSIMITLAACTTEIHAKDETILPPKTPFGNYQNIVLQPIQIAHMEGDSADKAAVATIQKEWQQCMEQMLPSSGTGNKLIITPTITDLKKVNVSERIFLGAMAGSSAVLLSVEYKDPQKNIVIAKPTFYAKTAAMSGAWTFGANDQAMIHRIANTACDYTRKYR